MVLVTHNNFTNDLQNKVILCKTYLRTLTEVSYIPNAILQWFQDLCRHLTEMIGLISRSHKEMKEKSKSYTGTILLYLTQIITTLSLLINIFVREEEIKIVLLEARKCVLKQMTCCLESVEIVFDCEKLLVDPTGNFVKWMDIALEKIAEIDIKHGARTTAIQVDEETRQTFEEVLSHAMSIAQVSLPEDSKIIRGNCQSVLSTLSSLEKEMANTERNTAMINLFIDACSDKLCMLEKKVNTAVLKLCLKTFSHFTLPLEKVQCFCFDSANKGKADELDSLVADFDLHVDRIMQIGLFAVSCSSDFTRGIKIRSCLASLEALESELVPAMTAVLLNNSFHNNSSATILMKHWLDQAGSLQQLIYLIIDPFAFCQVIYEEAAEIVDTLSISIRKKNIIKQNDVQDFISTTKVLQSFLEKAQGEFSEDEKNKVQTKLNDYSEVLEEVEKASVLLLNEKNNDIENGKRVLKRCKILLTVLKRLWFCFVDDTLERKDSNIVSEKQISELPAKFENIEIEPTGNPFLNHIINKGKQILQDRSVLYRTPIKNTSTRTKIDENKFTRSSQKQVPLLKVAHLRNLSFMNNIDKNESNISLQITDILAEMSNLSTLFKPQETLTGKKINTKTI